MFGSVRKLLAKLRKELEVERGRSIDGGPTRQERHLMAKISELLSREEAVEKQIARIDWLTDGYRNTSMFQAKSRERAKQNKISALCREDGTVATTTEEIEHEVILFYRNLFTAQQELHPEEICTYAPRRVSDDMNSRLTRPYTATEVEQALHMMGANKAPGPDGFTAGFYQVHWDVLGPSVTAATLNFLNGGSLPDGVKNTTIVLIPKTRNPQEMKEYRPTSLCNVIYKICSKVLALRRIS